MFVDGRRVRVASRPVRTGQEIRVHLEEGDRDPTNTGSKASIEKERILYQDRDLVAVDKPPGVSAQATLSSVEALPELVSATAGAPARLVHRLDLETSGLTVLGRHRRATSELTRAFREGRVEKTYMAVTLGRPRGLEGSEECGLLDRPLVKDPSARGRWMTARSGKAPAVTRWSLIEWFGGDVLAAGFSTVRLEPKTGRTHQLRVHLREAGSPILGDRRYGAPSFITRPDGTRIEIPRMMLHAARLVLPHPKTGELLALDAGTPPDIRELIAALGGKIELV